MINSITLIIIGAISFFSFVFLIGYGAKLEQKIKGLEDEKRRQK